MNHNDDSSGSSIHQVACFMTYINITFCPAAFSMSSSPLDVQQLGSDSGSMLLQDAPDRLLTCGDDQPQESCSEQDFDGLAILCRQPTVVDANASLECRNHPIVFFKISKLCELVYLLLCLIQEMTFQRSHKRKSLRELTIIISIPCKRQALELEIILLTALSVMHMHESRCAVQYLYCRCRSSCKLLILTDLI